MPNSNWYESADNVLELAHWLRNYGAWDGDSGVSNLLYFFEKPWKWRYEWELYLIAKQFYSDDDRPIALCSMCKEEVDPGESWDLIDEKPVHTRCLKERTITDERRERSSENHSAI